MLAPRARPLCLKPIAAEAALEPPLLIALQPLVQQPHVASVRAPQNVEGVADQRHCAEQAVERDVAEHARDDVARRAELICLVHDKQRQRRGDDVADGGKEPDQRIEAEAHGGAGDNKRGVEQGRKRVDPGNAGATGAGAGKVEVEVIGGGHCVLRGPDGDAGQRAQGIWRPAAVSARCNGRR
jgi:hypothetical protein